MKPIVGALKKTLPSSDRPPLARVGLGEEADRVDAVGLAAAMPDVEIGNDGGRIERVPSEAVTPLLRVKRECGGIGILLPAFGERGADLSGGIDIDELSVTWPQIWPRKLEIALLLGIQVLPSESMRKVCRRRCAAHRRFEPA